MKIDHNYVEKEYNVEFEDQQLQKKFDNYIELITTKGRMLSQDDYELYLSSIDFQIDVFISLNDIVVINNRNYNDLINFITICQSKTQDNSIFLQPIQELLIEQYPNLSFIKLYSILSRLNLGKQLVFKSWFTFVSQLPYLFQDEWYNGIKQKFLKLQKKNNYDIQQTIEQFIQQYCPYKEQYIIQVPNSKFVDSKYVFKMLCDQLEQDDGYNDEPPSFVFLNKIDYNIDDVTKLCYIITSPKNFGR